MAKTTTIFKVISLQLIKINGKINKNFKKRKLTFSCRLATAGFPKFAGILSAALSQPHLLGFEIAQLEFHHLH